MKNSFVVGSRGSPLALKQSQIMLEEIQNQTQFSFSLEVIQTTGDRAIEEKFSQIGVKGLFTKELDEALLSHKIDFAIHSLKDLPSELTPGIALTCVTASIDPRDVFVSRKGSFRLLPAGSNVGTSSLRRTAQILKLRGDLCVLPLRGNLDTRIKKLERGDFDAIVLAAAGMKRMGWESKITEYFDPLEMIPSVGQGRLAMTCREEDAETKTMLESMSQEEEAALSFCERIFMKKIEGGCQVPFGAYSQKKQNEFFMVAFLSHEDGSHFLRDEIFGEWKNRETLAKNLAERMLMNGGDKILAHLRSPSSK